MRTIKAKLASPPTGRIDGAGIDHDVWVAWENEAGDDVDFLHATFPIPLYDFIGLLVPMTDGARVSLYKSLIAEFYGTFAIPLVAPQPPSGLNDLEAVDDYLDARDAYRAELAVAVESSAIIAEQATTWIEGLSGFEGWPFSFTLQVGD